MNTKLKFLYIFFTLIITGTVYCQSPDLLLDLTDIREEPAEYNNVEGYNIFIRQKQGMESVMLTESSGFHALRATEWNPINGNEIRKLSGIALSGDNSRYSIVSSTPIPDVQFGKAFQLFLPKRVVFGNPLSATGTVYMDINDGNQFNIRTFDSKYADPNKSNFKNNLYVAKGTLINNNIPLQEIASGLMPEKNDPIYYIKMYLEAILDNKSEIETLKKMSNRELFYLLKNIFKKK